MVDSTDRERLVISKEELYRMLAHEVTSQHTLVQPEGNVSQKSFHTMGHSFHHSCGLIVLLSSSLTPATTHPDPHLPSGPAESSCFNICQQAGYEELYVCSRDLQLPHPELYQRPPLAHTVLLCTDWRGVRDTFMTDPLCN